MRLIQFEPSERQLLKQFIQIPFDLYKGSDFWVPPLRGKQFKLIQHKEGMQLRSGPYVLFLVEHHGKNIARVLAGVNQAKNKQRNQNEGYFALFECVNDPQVARLLLEGAMQWLAMQGVERVTGPVSPTNGDELRGVLIAGKDQLPAINTTYTMPYYNDLLEELGFEKYLDFHALTLVFNTNELVRVQRIVEYGQKKKQLEVSRFNFKDIDGEVRAIHQIMIAAAQTHWEHLELPTEEQIREVFESMKKQIDPDLVMIARVKGEPVGFVAGIPDYNQVLCHMNGRMTPLSILKYFYYKNRITRARMFMQFVLPKYQNSFVTPTLYLRLFEGFQKRGYTEMEGSTIAEYNLTSIAAIKGVGFEPNRVYRIYQKPL